MSLKRSIAIGITAIMVLAAIASCVGPALAQGGDDDVLNIAIQQDTPNFNYMDLASNSVWKKYVLGAWVFEAMTVTDPEGNLFPLLAKDWVFDEPTLTVTVELRSGVKFHDGVVMTADDVVFSYMANRDGTTYSSFIIDIFDADGDGQCSADEVDGAIDSNSDGKFEGITKVDDTHVKFVMAKPYGQFFLQGLGVPVLPEHIWADHLTAEGTIDVLWNTDEKATIGTGAFKYDSGVRNVFRKLVKFEDYWGKTELSPSGHHLYPQEVDTIYLKIYSSLDTAILALKSGQVEHIPWTVTPGYVPDLIANPETDIQSISDNGYFYLAFNMKREPMNYIGFRQAVSHCIDKRIITDRYMGGFGQPGDSSEPPFWQDWYNSSVPRFAYDVASARVKLEDAGFTGIGTALKTPDGKAVPPLVLLTPPADYDPVRIKAGEMIAKNLRSLGIDVVAKPVDFDTLVAKMNAFDYDMLIIGWSLSQDPVGNVFDILGPLASQNYFGFWSLVNNNNPWYKDLGGVSTKADSQTQALADKVKELQDLAKASFDLEVQIKYTKWGQGVIAEALPCNVLYYRVNNYAISTRWTGWTPYLGELFHIYSVSELRRGTAPPPAGELTAILNVPDKLAVGTDTDAYVSVIDEAGMPVEGATVTLTGIGVTFPTASGTTDATGVFKFKVNGGADAYVTINAEAVKGTAQFETSKIVSVVGGVPPSLFVTAKPDKLYLLPGENTDVYVKVTDKAGVGVSGVEVALDENLMGYGSINDATINTDGTGTAKFTWTAPAAAVLNKNIEVRLEFTVTPTGGYKVDRISTVTQFVVLKNTSPSQWHFVKVVGATQYACNLTNKSTDVTVMAVDATGAPISGEPIGVTYSNPAALASPVTTVTTNATGHAVVTITFADGIDTNSTQVFFKNVNVPNAVGAGMNLLFKGSTVPTMPLYGGVIQIDQLPMLDPDTTDELLFDIMLYDLDGKLATGDVPIGLVIGEPSDGSTAAMVDAPANMWPSLYDYAGLNIFSSADKGSITSGGYFMADKMADAEYAAMEGAYASWTEFLDADGGWYDYGAPEDDDTYAIDTLTDMAAYTVTDGHAQISIMEDVLVLSDNIPSIIIIPMGRTGFYATPDFNNYWWEIHGDTAWKTEFVVQRTANMASAKYEFDTGIVRDFAPDNVANIQLWVYDQDNAPIEGVTVRASSVSARYFDIAAGAATDADGKTTTTVTGKHKNAANALLTNPVKQSFFIEPTVEGSATSFAMVETHCIPLQLYLTMDVTPVIQETAATATATVKAKVVDETGAAVPDLKVTFSSEGGSLSADNATTDASGEGTVTYTVPDVAAGENFAYGKVATQALKDGYGAASSSFTVVAYNMPPEIKDLSLPDTGYETYMTTVALSGKATDLQGLSYLRATLDSTTPVNITVAANGSFTHSMATLAVGDHSVVLTAEDIKGQTTTKTVTFKVKENLAPEVKDLSKADGFKTTDTTFTLSGKATDDVGVSTVKIVVDGGAATTLTVTNGTWSYKFTDLEVGKHTAVITVNDTLGRTGTKTLNFEVEEEGAGTSWLLWVIIIIIILVIVVLVVMMMMRKKPAEAPKAEEAK